jgi:signal peptidase II
MDYIENPGMAFGTTFGSTIWAKLSLSIFRIIAIGAITYYIIKQAKNKMRLEFLIALGLILAGAAGNLIDSMFYDYIFPVDQWLNCHMEYNLMPGSGNLFECDYYGMQETVEIRNTGFLFGNVVDMFQFQATWPDWMPLVGGKDVFPAVWNIADASITIGIIMVFLRHRVHFPKEESKKKSKFRLSFLKGDGSDPEDEKEATEE